MEHWRNPKLGAAAIVSEAGRVLLTRRAHAPWRGLWCAPSGFCDLDEHPTHAAERETYEETGIRVNVTGYIGIWLDRYSDDPLEEDDAIAVAYYHARPTGEPADRHDPDEVAEMRWFAAEELPDGLAPPRTLPVVLAAWRADLGANRTQTPLHDRC
jgi:ADP-ribose pyrophosphatase YjhB (NUDIX family)